MDINILSTHIKFHGDDSYSTNFSLEKKISEQGKQKRKPDVQKIQG